MCALPDWELYERYVEGLYAEMSGGPNSDVTYAASATMEGRKSGNTRTVDVCVKGKFAGLVGVTLVVDCKRRRRPVDITQMDAFIGLVRDVGAEVGILVTTKRPSAAAMHRAEQASGIHVDFIPDALATGFRGYRPRPGESYWYSSVEDCDGTPVRSVAYSTPGHRDEVLSTEIDWGVGTGAHDALVLIWRHLQGEEPSDDVFWRVEDELSWKLYNGREWVIWEGQLYPFIFH